MEEKEVFVLNSNFIFPIYLQPDGINLWHFKLRLFNLTFEKSKIYIGLQNYRLQKIRVCGKNSVPILFFTSITKGDLKCFLSVHACLRRTQKLHLKFGDGDGPNLCRVKK